MAIVANGPAPYAPPRTITDLIMTYRDRDLRKPFTLDVLMRAGVSESLAPRTLHALKLLDLINQEGNPTKAFEEVSRLPEAEFKKGLGDLFISAYADALAFANPATESLDRVRDAFRTYTPRGQQDRMVTLFLGLLEFAGLDVSAAKASSKALPKASSTQPRANPRIRTAPKQQRNMSKEDALRRARDADYSGLPPALAGLLRSLPSSGGWTKDRRDQFMDTFGAVLDFTIPIVEEEFISLNGEAEANGEG